MSDSPNSPEAPEFDKEELKRALKAFKKRIKLLRRDDESKLGGGAFTGGRKSGIVGIVPPEGFPPEIWTALVAKGRLKPVPGTQRRRQYEIVPQG